MLTVRTHGQEILNLTDDELSLILPRVFTDLEQMGALKHMLAPGPSDRAGRETGNTSFGRTADVMSRKFRCATIPYCVVDQSRRAAYISNALLVNRKEWSLHVALGCPNKRPATKLHDCFEVTNQTLASRTSPPTSSALFWSMMSISWIWLVLVNVIF